MTGNSSSGLPSATGLLPASRRNYYALVGCLAVLVIVRMLPAASVFRDGFVVLSSNDPYAYRYALEQLLAGNGSLRSLPGVGSGEPLLLTVVWVVTSLFGGSSLAGGLVLALYPVLAAVVTGYLVYAIAVRVGGDSRFGLAAVVSLYVMLLKLSFLGFLRFVVDVSVAVYIYHQRDVYTPGTQARYDAIRARGVLAQFGVVRALRRGETAPLGMRAVVAAVGLVTVVSFFQGVYYIWGHGGAGTVFGLLIVLMAGVQAYVLYGLWTVERWAWFAGLFLFGLAAVIALFRIFLYNDVVAVAEFFLYGAITLYTVRRKPTYAPRVTVDLTPR